MGDGTFAQVAESSIFMGDLADWHFQPFNRPLIADIDQDGDSDMLVVADNGNLHLFRNPNWTAYEEAQPPKSAPQLHYNPMTQSLQLQTEHQDSHQISLFNQQGQLLLSTTISAGMAAALPALPLGLYWYQLRTTNTDYSGPLLLGR